MTRLADGSGSYLRNRFTWLVVIPVGFGFAAWLVLLVPTGFSPANLAVSAVLPLLGMLAVLVYKRMSRDRVLLIPYLPFAIAGVAFAALMFDLAVAVSHEPDGAFIPIFQLGVGFIEPWLALIGGLISFLAVSNRTG